MSFFSKYYNNIKYPIKETPEDDGLRNAQIGAIHSIAAHFTISQLPAMVVMPTGTGKTAVLMMSAFLLKSQRVLVITPSKLVRSQITENLNKLQPLKRIGVIDVDEAEIRVKEQVNKLTDADLWNELSAFDVVVSTPNCISPEISGIAPPPTDLFDLILIDEAHHSPAKTWAGLMHAFNNSKQVLFTATPFRRDKKIINAKLIYNYPISFAYQDKVFGQVEYIPVIEEDANDISIAKKAEQVLKSEPEGIKHYLMVRTDTKTRAEELSKIYAENTSLRLQTIHSDLTSSTVERTIKKLRSGDLDGIVCVDMLGEGFDFPNLKIAAIHSPHKSLAATLQFIGRFARTNATDIGNAKFIAIPKEIEIERKMLYRSNSVWQDLIIELSENKINQEVLNREVVDNFEINPDDTIEELTEFSLQSIEPYYHVKIFKIFNGSFDAKADLDFTKFKAEIIYRQDDEIDSALLLILKESKTPKWLKIKSFEDVKHHLILVYYDINSSFLFINSSIKNSIEFYETIAYDTTNASDVKILSDEELNSVLGGISDAEFFNIGMRNRATYGTNESYKIISGQTAHNSIDKSDANIYHRGHLFGKGKENGSEITIGLSSSSKVWSNFSSHIAGFLSWTSKLAQKLIELTDVKTGTPLDYLPLSAGIDTLPNENVIAIDWNVVTYKGFVSVNYEGFTTDIRNIDIEFDKDFSDRDNIFFAIRGSNFDCKFIYSLNNDKYFTSLDSELSNRIIVQKGQQISYNLESYINNFPLNFYYGDFSVVCNNDKYLKPIYIDKPFDENHILIWEWDKLNVDITFEVEDPKRYKETEGKHPTNMKSIHEALNEYILAINPPYILYDHGTGETADFVTAEIDDNDDVLIKFYHCKGSGEASAGNRVGDVYEVVGQGVKSLKSTEKSKLIRKIAERDKVHRDKQLNGYRYDTSQMLQEFLATHNDKPITFEIILVQPGITKSGIEEKISLVLSAANRYIMNSRGCKPIKVIGTE